MAGGDAFVLTDVARQSLRHRCLWAGWESWIPRVSREEEARQVNSRLGRISAPARLRAAEVAHERTGAAVKVLRSVVAPEYRAFSDARVAEILSEAFRGAKPSVHRLAYTEKTLSYALRVGDPFRPGGDAAVGDLQGGLLVQNSRHGCTRLQVSAYLVSLADLNGMPAPVGDPTIFSQAVVGDGEEPLRRAIEGAKGRLKGIAEEGGARLLAARNVPVEDPTAEFRRLLREAFLPPGRIIHLEAAFVLEPEASAFGVAQAATRASSCFASEDRHELERAVSRYVAWM